MISSRMCGLLCWLNCQSSIFYGKSPNGSLISPWTFADRRLRRCLIWFSEKPWEISIYRGRYWCIMGDMWGIRDRIFNLDYFSPIIYRKWMTAPLTLSVRGIMSFLLNCDSHFRPLYWECDNCWQTSWEKVKHCLISSHFYRDIMRGIPGICFHSGNN